MLWGNSRQPTSTLTGPACGLLRVYMAQRSGADGADAVFAAAAEGVQVVEASERGKLHVRGHGSGKLCVGDDGAGNAASSRHSVTSVTSDSTAVSEAPVDVGEGVDAQGTGGAGAGATAVDGTAGAAAPTSAPTAHADPSAHGPMWDPNAGDKLNKLLHERQDWIMRCRCSAALNHRCRGEAVQATIAIQGAAHTSVTFIAK